MTRWRNGAVTLLGLGVLAVLYWSIGVGEVADAFARLRGGYLLAYLVVAAAVCAGYSLRWYVVARALGEAPAFSRLVAARLAGDAVSLLAPVGRVGGDPVRVALVYGDGVSGARASAGVAIDRIIELIGNSVCAVAYVSIFSVAYTLGASWDVARLVIAAVLLPLSALVLLLVQLRRGRRPLTALFRVRTVLQRPHLRRWLETIRRAEDDMQRFVRDRPRLFIGGIFGSLVIEALIVVEYHLLFAAFGLPVDLPTLLAILVTTGVMRAVPVPAGLGALEAGQVSLLAVTQGRPGVGLVVGTVLRLHETLWTAIGLGVLAVQGGSLARLRLLVSERKAAA